MHDNIYISGHLIPLDIQTPHMIYSEDDLFANSSLIKESFSGAEVYFAVKSCYAPPVLSMLAYAGFGAEVMSEFEYSLAEKNGFLPEKIILNGLGRSEALLERACQNGSTIIVDSAGDFQKIKKIAQTGVPMHLGIRLRVGGLESFKTPYGNIKNKLGTDKTDQLFSDFLDLVFSTDTVSFKLLHAHFTINERNSAVYLHALREIKKTLNLLAAEHPHVTYPTHISIGGGFYPFGRDEDNAAKSMFSEINKQFKELFPDQVLCVEPGRFLTNTAGYVVTSVVDRKTASGYEHILVDAGTNVLIPIPSVHYALQNCENDESVSFSLADGITSPDNVIVKDATASALPVEGQRIVLKNCGAYTDVLSEFWVYMPYSGSFLSSEGRLISYRDTDNLRIARQNMWGI